MHVAPLLSTATDILVALLIMRTMRTRGASPRLVSIGVALWLFNPFTATISTRGNGESIVLALIYS